MPDVSPRVADPTCVVVRAKARRMMLPLQEYLTQKTNPTPRTLQ